MFAIVENAQRSSARRGPDVTRCTETAARAVLVSVNGLRGPRRAFRRAAGMLRDINCGLAVFADSFPDARREQALSLLGLCEPDERPLMRALAGRMSLIALGARECETAAVYAARFTRDVAEAVSLLCGRVRSVALSLEDGEAECADAMYAYFGTAAVRAPGEAARAGFHLVFDEPRGGLNAARDAAAVSLCGDIAGLPSERYTGAALLPPENMRVALCTREDAENRMAAALYARRAVRPEEVRIVRLNSPGKNPV